MRLALRLRRNSKEFLSRVHLRLRRIISRVRKRFLSGLMFALRLRRNRRFLTG